MKQLLLLLLFPIAVAGCISKDDGVMFTQPEVDKIIESSKKLGAAEEHLRLQRWAVDCVSKTSKAIDKLPVIKNSSSCCNYAIAVNNTLKETLNLFGTMPPLK